MNTQAIKGRALAAITAALTLLVIVIVMAKGGQSPILLGFIDAALFVYGLRMLLRLRKTTVK